MADCPFRIAPMSPEPTLFTGGSPGHLHLSQAGVLARLRQLVAALLGAVPPGGSEQGYLRISFVSLAALSSPGYDPMEDQPSRIFIHRRA